MLKNDSTLQLSIRQSEWLFYISLIMLSVFVFLFLGESGYVLFDDSFSYMDFQGNMEGVMPVYPLFLHANRLLFGEDQYLYMVVVEQAALASACVILFISVIRKQFGLKYWEAYVCYALALLPFMTDMPQVMTTHEILTEGIAYALFYLFAAALMRAVWDKSLKWLGVLYLVTIFLSLIRSQLQILFCVCGSICIYIVVLRKSGNGKRKLLLRFLCGLAGCVIIALTGVWSIGKLTGAYRQSKDEAERQRRQQEAQVQKEIQATKPVITASQYVSDFFQGDV